MKKVIVPISGGKDSQTCLKLAIEEVGKENVLGLFCDTKFEHPDTYTHIKNLSKREGVEVVTLCEGNVLDKVIHHGRFPSGIARFCTNELKIQPSKRYYIEYARKHGASIGNSFEVWYGIRKEESGDRARRYKGVVGEETYKPNDFMKKYPKYLYEELGVRFRLPIVDWSEEDVLEYLAGEENPLYRKGFKRVGCFPCLAAGDKNKEKAFQHDSFGREQYIKVMKMEDILGKRVWQSAGGLERNPSEEPGCSLCSI